MNWKFYLALVLLILVILFALQNAGAVTIRFLFWKLSLSQSLVIFCVGLAGALFGWILGVFRRTGRKK